MTYKWEKIVVSLFPGMVVTLSFNAKMVLANFECNLKRLETPRNGFKKVTCSLWERRRAFKRGSLSGFQQEYNNFSGFP